MVARLTSFLKPNFGRSVGSALNRAMYGSNPIFNKFPEGSVLLTEDSYVKFVQGKPMFGREMPDAVDSGAFIAPKENIDDLLDESKGNRGVIEKALGFDAGYLEGHTLYRLNIFDPAASGLRKPTATSGGANDHFVASDKPWGKTSGGVPEAFVSRVPMTTTMIMSDGGERVFQNVTASKLRA